MWGGGGVWGGECRAWPSGPLDFYVYESLVCIFCRNSASSCKAIMFGLYTTKIVCGWVWVSGNRSIVMIFLVICTTNTVFDLSDAKPNCADQAYYTVDDWMTYSEQCMHGHTNLNFLRTVPNTDILVHTSRNCTQRVFGNASAEVILYRSPVLLQDCCTTKTM